MRLVFLSLAWIFGICLGSKSDPHSAIFLILLGSSGIFAILCWRRKPLMWGGICLLLLAGGILRVQSVPDGDELQQYRGFFELRGVVAIDPDVRDYSTTLRIEVKSILINDKWEDVSGTALVNAPKFPDLGTARDFPYYRYGDLLEMRGFLESPQMLGEFDFPEYLARQRVYSIVSRPSGITLIDAGEKPKPMELIYRLRNRMSQSLDRALPEPQSSLVKAILLGERGSLSAEVKDDFSRTGTTHLLAISGAHVSIVAGMVMAAGIWIFGRRRPTYFLLALAVIWFYALLTGMSPPVIRAVIMGSLWLWADWLGRPNGAFVALVFSAAIMLAIDPWLLGDAGFQLSFAAMGGVILLTPWFQERERKVLGNSEKEISPPVHFLITSSAMTLGAVLATMPLIAYHFHMISLMSLPATMFALPAMPGIMITSALVGLIGMVAPPIAGIIGWAAWLCVTYMLKAVEGFAAIPFAAAEIRISAATVWGYYGVLGITLGVTGNRRQVSIGIRKARKWLRGFPPLVSKIPAKWISLLLLGTAVLIWVAVLTAPDNRLHIFILDVGQGDAILIQKGHQQILIDGGPSSAKLCDQLGKKLPFWDRTIELVVLTHPDGDHITGLIEVLQRYEVKRVLVNGQECNSDVCREWDKLIAEKHIECLVAQAGQQIAMGKGINLAVLNPHGVAEGIITGQNNSVVLRLDDQNFSMLLTGDTEAEAEEFLLGQNVKLKSTVLKVGHHGSNTSTTPEFLAEVNPMVAVISVGLDNKFGHPTQEVISMLQESVGGERLHLTSKNGTIELVTDGKRLWIGSDAKKAQILLDGMSKSLLQFLVFLNGPVV
ncbi:MAG: DNA internalization-related competence protein ComEC/Rec2 [Dehalococcoidia bacterium]|nr:DNA internalization-related competence protein ComEC/Rec2 [Dehalococcoidia bacterium]